jgi:ankyrin repeat protein
MPLPLLLLMLMLQRLNTALHLAAEEGHVEVAEKLLDAGAVAHLLNRVRHPQQAARSK